MSALARAGCVVLVAASLALRAPPSAAFSWPNVPEEVARALASPDPGERRAATRVLVDLPREIATTLTRQALGDGDTEVRLGAAQAAVALRLPNGGDLVVAWLSDVDGRLRLAAADVIRVSPTPRSVVALGRVLSDPEPRVRLAAAVAIGASGSVGRDASGIDGVSPLLGHLDDPTPEVRAEVARALGRLGDARAVLPLVGKVQDAVPEVRKVVAHALGDLGDKRAASALVLALQDPAGEVRVEALGALGRLRAEDAVTAIVLVLRPHDDATAIAGRSGASAAEVRAAALAALGRIATPAAVKALVAELATDDPGAARGPVRDALVSAGATAAAPLAAVLEGSPGPQAAANAALALAALRAKDRAPVLVRAMQRGALPLRHGLRAIAELGSSDALPAVLELLDDADPTVRREAVRAASALLDPGRPDGRAVDPAAAALRDPGASAEERLALVRLLGRTGSARAQPVLLPLVRGRAPALRLAAIEALGALERGGGDVEAELFDALDDDTPEVRLTAARAIGRVGAARAAAELLSRLLVSAEADRGAIGHALSGALGRCPDDRELAARVAAAVPSASESARDALIEGLGRMPGRAAAGELARLASGGIDDRRKVAEALAGHAEARDTLRALADDSDGGVRANATWSLGAVGSRADAALLAAKLRDPDVAVAGDAAAALGRLAAREGDDGAAAAALCAAATHARAYVRADALLAIARLPGATCGATSAALLGDRAPVVRAAAALAIARTDPAAAKKDLARCAALDHDATVAARCGALAEGLPADAAAGTDDLLVLVVPDKARDPVPRAAFALVLADGTLRLGLADRRGAVFERAAPRGTVRLAVPAQLAP